MTDWEKLQKMEGFVKGEPKHDCCECVPKVELRAGQARRAELEAIGNLGKERIKLTEVEKDATSAVMSRDRAHEKIEELLVALNDERKKVNLYISAMVKGRQEFREAYRAERMKVREGEERAGEAERVVEAARVLGRAVGVFTPITIQAQSELFVGLRKALAAYDAPKDRLAEKFPDLKGGSVIKLCEKHCFCSIRQTRNPKTGERVQHTLCCVCKKIGKKIWDSRLDSDLSPS